MASEEKPPAGDRGEPPSRAIVEAIAEAKGVDPLDLGPPDHEPLYAVLDPEAIDSLFAGRESARLRVVFAYEGYEVTIRSGGRVDVTRVASDGPADTRIEE